MPLRLRVTSESPALPADQRQKEFAACGGTIGRSGENDWVLPDDKRYVSSRHAIIDYQAGAYYLVDTSRNGVYVNGSDTPVGNGMPQRLFDGDRLRIGEYEMAIEVTGGDENIRDDGMRDSIVRAQLMPEEESVELMLVAEDNLLRDSSLQKHLSPSSSVLKALKTGLHAPGVARAGSKPARPPAAKAPATASAPPSGPTAGAGAPAKASAARVAPARSDPVAEVPAAAQDPDLRAAARLLEAAGLRPDAIPGATPGEVLQVAGKLLRVLVTGLMETLREGGEIRETFHLPEPVAQPNQENPLRVSPTAEEALRFLLADRGERPYLGTEDAVRAAFRDLRQHEQALHRAIVQSISGYVEHFAPEELKARFDRGQKRGGLLSSANKLKYWDLYESSYGELTERSESGRPPDVYRDSFARAYGDALEAVRGSRGR